MRGKGIIEVVKGGQLLPIPNAVTAVLSALISFGVVTLLFAMIYKFLPDVKLPWGDVWMGALVTGRAREAILPFADRGFTY